MESEFRNAFEFGREAAALLQPRDVGGVPFLVIPDGYGVQSLEEYLDRPRTLRANVTVQDQASFVTYINRFKGANTTLFANRDRHALTCILDYHGEQAAHCAHRVSWSLQLSEEWTAWIGRNEKAQNQDAFAAFLEDRYREIAEPDASQVLHIAEHFEAKKSVVYRKAIRRDNDTVRFEYAEDADGGNGDITVPTSLVLGLRVYEHQHKETEAYRVNAKLRWGLGDAKITFTVKLEKPQDIVKAAFQDVLKGVSTATGLTPFHGAP